MVDAMVLVRLPISSNQMNKNTLGTALTVAARMSERQGSRSKEKALRAPWSVGTRSEANVNQKR
jgi:hypothetical protein